jgi:asparaginyl-tRNA synthetase
MSSTSRAAHSIRKLLALGGQAGTSDSAVEVRGWVRAMRTQKNVSFVSINDGSQPAHLQVVCPPELLKGISHGSSIHVKGLSSARLHARCVIAR